MILRPTFLFSAGGVVACNLQLTVDGTLINIPDTVAAAYPLAPVTTTNGYTVTVDNDINGVAGNLKIKIDGLEVWESIPVRMKVVKATFETYDQTFTVFGYDIGNTHGGGGVLTNPPFIIFCLQTSFIGILPTTGVIAYRKPFSSRLYYYNGTADGSTNLLYDVTSGTDVLLGRSGFIDNNDETVQIKTLNNSGITATSTVDYLKAIWVPPFTLSVDSDCPDGDCISTISSNTASVAIDYTVLTLLRVDDVSSYAYDNQEITYRLFRFDGTLVSEKKFGFEINPPPYVFPTVTYDWTGWSVPEVGDFIVEACLEIWQKPTTNQIVADDLVVGLWYEIIDNSGAADWTNVGAPDNLVGTQFMATDVTPTAWGTGILELIDKAYECCTRVPIVGCSWYKITQKSCNVYTVSNNAFETITVLVQAMDTLGAFEATGTLYTLLQGESVDITHADDGVYQYTATRGTEVFIQIVVNTCSIKTCAVAFINDLLCYCKDNGCGDFCEEFYNFNAFTVLSHTLFNMLNSLYSLDYMFTTLSTTKVAELYEIKQVIDKLKEYCEGCVTCESCTKNKTKCNCKH